MQSLGSLNLASPWQGFYGKGFLESLCDLTVCSDSILEVCVDAGQKQQIDAWL